MKYIKFLKKNKENKWRENSEERRQAELVKENA